MAQRDQPTPRLPFEGNDEHGAEPDPDLPLASIPSIPSLPSLPDEPLGSPERRGASSYVVGGAALFVLIVAVSLLGARYLKMPTSGIAVAPVEEHALLAGEAESAAAVPAPADREQVAQGARGAQHPVLQQSPAVAPPPPAASPEVGRLTRELQAANRALAEAERAAEREREARRAAERRADELGRAGKGATARTQPATKADKKAKARLAELEREVTRLRKELDQRERASATSREAATSRDRERVELAGKLEAAERRARESERQLAESRTRHESTMQGESDAVRKLVADLNAARDQAAKEKAARVEAEKSLRSLEGEVARLRAGGAPAASAPATASRSLPQGAGGAQHPAVKAPARADVREPERIKTVPPRYPEELRRIGVSGRVLLKLLVSEQGNVEEVQVSSTPDARLAAVATEAARRWQYTPGRKDGTRAKMWITEAVDFKL